MSRRFLRLTLPVLALLVFLPAVAAAGPAGSEPGRPALRHAAADPVAAILSRLAGLVASIWGADSAGGDTGMSIDPNGLTGQTGGAESDTGMLIDPHG